MPKGSFHEDRNDLLTRFAQRRRHEAKREERRKKSPEETFEHSRCRSYRLNQSLFERAGAD